MRLLRHSIRTRVAILVLVPVLSLLGLYVFATMITAGAAITLAKATTSRNSVADPIGFYFTDLQGERILATLYLATPTARDLAALTAQESKSDAALAELNNAAHSSGFQSAASAEVKAAMAATLQGGTGLSALRQAVASRAVSRATTQAAYTKVIAAGMSAISASILQQPNVPLVSQSLDVLQTAQAEDILLQSEVLLVGDVTARDFPAADHARFARLVGAYRGLLAQALSGMTAQYRGPFNRAVSARSLDALQASETIVINSRPGELPAIRLAAYDQAARAVATGLAVTGYASGLTLATSLHQAAGPIDLRLILAGGLGLLAILVSVAVSVLIGRRLVQQLHELRDDALALAHHRLPRAMARLSAGEHLDVEAEAPPLAASADEIGQVRQAFNSVQRSAIEAAVNQARLRSGISTIFRNVARRSQVLLHQQLALLDALERRAAEPAELEGLFRIDHLTTRMRRHAEGFVVLAGDRPGRTWTEPVPLADVLRGAVAEVVDYARIRVVCTSRAALHGRAVADAIHLIAELAENATVFSPPHAPVRIVGSLVVRGFAIEIEDRGFGMSKNRMAEANAAFLDPPQLDFPESQQLGLYVAARLAQRHDIKVTLRSSPFGGTTAILLIPMELIVTDVKDAAQDRVAGSESRPSEANSAPTGRHASRGSAAESRFVLPADLSAGVNGQAPHNGVNGEAPHNGVNGQAPHNGGEQWDAGSSTDTGSWELPDWMYGNGGGPDKLPAEPEPAAEWAAQPEPPAEWAAQPEPPAEWAAQPEPPAERPAQPEPPAELRWPGQPAAGSGGILDDFNLPRRVRLASLTPQLRESVSSEIAGIDSQRTPERSPDEVRDRLSAMQLGWERGRKDGPAAVELGEIQADGIHQPPLDPPAVGGNNRAGT